MENMADCQKQTIISNKKVLHDVYTSSCYEMKWKEEGHMDSHVDYYLKLWVWTHLTCVDAVRWADARVHAVQVCTLDLQSLQLCPHKEPCSERLQYLMLQCWVYTYNSATWALMQQGVWVKPPVHVKGSHAWHTVRAFSWWRSVSLLLQTQFLSQSKPHSNVFLETHSGCHVPITDFYKDHLRSKWKQLCSTRALRAFFFSGKCFGFSCVRLTVNLCKYSKSGIMENSTLVRNFTANQQRNWDG